MGFTVPTFNLTVNVWHGGIGPPNPPSLVTVGNLAYGRRVQTALTPESTGSDPAVMTLLLPAGTDVRDVVNAAQSDFVEVPAGTRRIYQVVFVDDAGKGFPNEHRIALLQQSSDFGLWPVPMP